MSPPRRWKDGGEVDSFARQLLESAEPTRELSVSRRARGARRVERWASGAAAGAVGTVFGIGSVKGAVAAFGLGVVSAVGVLAAVPVLGEPWLHRTSARAEEPRPELVPTAGHRAAPPQAPAENAPAPPPPPSAIELPPSPGLPLVREAARALPAKRRSEAEHPLADSHAISTVDAEHHLTAPPSEKTGPMSPDLSAELTLIWEARKLVSASPAAAETVLQRHARLYPEGAMSLERDVLLVEVLDRRGLHEQAAARARALLAAGASGIYEARLRHVAESQR